MTGGVDIHPRVQWYEIVETKEGKRSNIKNAVFIFLIYTADYEDHGGFEGIALKCGLEFVARLAKI